MKVLMLNGSPHVAGNTHRALCEIGDTLKAEGIDSEIVWVGNHAVQGCVGCYKCVELGHCVFQEPLMRELQVKCAEADALIVGSPVYYAGPAGSLTALLDRLFYSYGRVLRHKPASAVAVCRRGGASSALDRLNKYFAINNMPIVTSQYWNLAYGRNPGEVEQDGEGMQTMRALARNMAWMLRNQYAAGAALPPEAEPRVATNFIR